MIIFQLLAGVHNASKRIITSSSIEDEYDPKLLSNVSDLLNTNRFEPLVILHIAKKQHYMRQVTSKNDKNNLSSEYLSMVFNNIANKILETAMSLHVKSMAQETHATFSNPDLGPLKADKVL